MQDSDNSPVAFSNALPADRKEAINKLRHIFLNDLPAGFTETMAYGMISYVVPFSAYPKGYHVDTKLALPFISIASQKNHIAIYHMGMYAQPELLQWFVNQMMEWNNRKPDMGKSCIRFKKPEQIPYHLITELAKKITVQQWIELYEKSFRK